MLPAGGLPWPFLAPLSGGSWYLPFALWDKMVLIDCLRDVIYLKEKNISLASLPRISWESIVFCPFALQSVLEKTR